ncbi:unnamed protein product (macronuclear) [Paramecium tetraurelia]|uniref:Uncharacterized protein n=2 Tax=Paramecium TaxID=5884 RepID=A0C1D0_PARTE|nr:uncharacterized protein GSPATT00034073001 [Paramecium tetraurelia]CAD8211795.1 unnamed protein product [Paramecium octaurelia]CAK64597.1 unnamed protein product [Paramecium tetraurelia]|eukprot:XP_001431995.1 hypothetical protein (macronuclear) [Paramecium tetraurelia strain d4-2]
MDKSQPIKRSSKQRDTDYQEKPQSKIMQDTQQSSQQYIITDATFELIIRERDALIERLEYDQRQLKYQLEQKKIELYELSQRFTSQRGNHLLKLQQSGVQLKQIQPDADAYK